MKKITALVVTAVITVSAVFAVSYKNNTYQKLAQEYTVKAEKALDAGEYALAEEYAKLAEENAALSEAYIAKMKAKSEAEEVMAAAKKQMAQVVALAGDIPLPPVYDEAESLYENAEAVFEEEDYVSAKTNAAKAAEKAVLAESYIRQQLAKVEADEAINAAKERIAYVEEIRGDISYPLAYEAGLNYLQQAQNSYDREDYAGAKAQAELVMSALAEIKPLTPLPKFYVVRPWAETKDCFWNISGRPYVYNNPFLWENLYEANKKKLPKPENPNLILPGMVMEIPSISGEYRDGYWSPDEEYMPFVY